MKKIILCLVVMLTVLCGVCRADLRRNPISQQAAKSLRRDRQILLRDKITARPPANDEEKISACILLSTTYADIPTEEILPDLVKLSDKYNCSQLLQTYKINVTDKKNFQLPMGSYAYSCYIYPLFNDRVFTIVARKIREIIADIKDVDFAEEGKMICTCRQLLRLERNTPELQVQYDFVSSRKTVRIATSCGATSSARTTITWPEQLNCDEILRSELNTPALVCLGEILQTRPTPTEKPQANPAPAVSETSQTNPALAEDSSRKEHLLYGLIGLNVLLICGVALLLVVRKKDLPNK